MSNMKLQPLDPMIFHQRFICDEDGWVLMVNHELGYPHFLHVVPPKDIKTITMKGDLEVTYIGFVNDSKYLPPPSSLLLYPLYQVRTLLHQ